MSDSWLQMEDYGQWIRPTSKWCPTQQATDRSQQEMNSYFKIPVNIPHEDLLAHHSQPAWSLCPNDGLDQRPRKYASTSCAYCHSLLRAYLVCRAYITKTPHRKYVACRWSATPSCPPLVCPMILQTWIHAALPSQKIYVYADWGVGRCFYWCHCHVTIMSNCFVHFVRIFVLTGAYRRWKMPTII